LIEASEEEKYSNNIMLFCSQNFIMNNDDPALAAIVMTPVERALLLIGFNPLERSRIIADGFASFEDLRDLTEKDIRTMAEDFSRKPVARGVSYGLTRVRKTLGLMHWAQDSYRISCVPDIATLTNDAIVVANQRVVRGKEEQQYETICKTALPSKERLACLPYSISQLFEVHARRHRSSSFIRMSRERNACFGCRIC
jgi:hypothetical protein